MAGALASLAAARSTQAGTPFTENFPYFGGIARLDSVPDGWGAGVIRVRMQPGQAWDFTYPGPVSAYVDSGTLTIDNKLLGRFSMGDNQGGPLSGGASSLSNEISAGSGVTSRDGKIGALRNNAQQELVLFILSAVPPIDPDSYESVEEHDSATPTSP